MCIYALYWSIQLQSGKCVYNKLTYFTNFWKFWPIKFISGMQVHAHLQHLQAKFVLSSPSGQGQGHRAKHVRVSCSLVVYLPLKGNLVLYTVSQKIGCRNFCNNFTCCQPILKILSLLETAMNYLQNKYNIFRPLLNKNLAVYYCVKHKSLKMLQWQSCCSSRNWSYEVWAYDSHQFFAVSIGGQCIIIIS